MGQPEECNVACREPMPRRRSWWRRLYPATYCPIPDAPGTFEGCITLRSVGKFGLVERLKILLTGIVCFEARIVCERDPGHTISRGECNPGLSRDLLEIP